MLPYQGQLLKKALAAVVIIVVLVAAAFTGILLSQKLSPSKAAGVYVGVAYCGNTVADGKTMIDKVKGYTNLFVLQSGLLQRDLDSVNELGDYAVANDMYFLPYFGQVTLTLTGWLQEAKQKWGDHLLGVYYTDEPAGRMMDGYREFKDATTGDTITKTTYGDIVVTKPNGIVINYQLNGIIRLDEPAPSGSNDVMSEEVFYPDGTIQVIKPAPNGFSYHSYQELLEIKPFTTLDETAERFIARDKTNIDTLKTNGTQVFTSDYALYWFDYLAGYDVVLGQVGWNLSLNQQVGFMRGAGNMLNKDWGVIVAWKYQQTPYLASGTEIFDQLKTTYECGAKYFVLFDYYFEDDPNPYGTLKDEHFEALRSFWNDVVTSPTDTWNSVKADSVLVFPQN
jgi:hypothetical protein